MADKNKKPRGRPPLPMPEQIPDTPENVARLLMTTKPKKENEWRYLKEHKEQQTKKDPG